MILFIGGVPRSGKTQLAEKISYTTRFPIIHLDILREMFERAEPSLGIVNGNDPDRNALRMWRFIKAYAEKAAEEEYDYIFEGSDLLPGLVSEILLSIASRAVFLGYSTVSENDKVLFIRNNQSAGVWTATQSNSALKDLVRRNIKRSIWLKAECQRFGVQYFDTVEDFEHTIVNLANMFN